ncbi:MAG: hypothetical protein QOI91_2344 [Solirubrobacteraceae bacterium]|jgi:hypothetical protein|nr:hypothetical protein [Solirubrobacteraceae bacterium]
MASKRTAKVGDAASAARSNPYVQRVIEDAELRETLREAYERSRSAYGRLSNGKAPSKALMEDKKLQKELKAAVAAIGAASTALREGPKKRRKRGGLGRKLLVLAVGAGLALALSEGLRKKVLDTMFGAEEEFDYTSTTTPAPAPETSGAAA